MYLSVCVPFLSVVKSTGPVHIGLDCTAYMPAPFGPSPNLTFSVTRNSKKGSIYSQSVPDMSRRQVSDNYEPVRTYCVPRLRLGRTLDRVAGRLVGAVYFGGEKKILGMLEIRVFRSEE